MSSRADIGTWAGEFGGVFTLGDLRALYGDLSEAGVYKKLERMIARGEQGEAGEEKTAGGIHGASPWGTERLGAWAMRGAWHSPVIEEIA